MECALVLARASAEAGARLAGARPAHLDLLRGMAEAGTLRLGVPLLGEDGSYRGSLMLVAPEELGRYLSAEPFRAQGVWESHEVHRFRIAPLPYRPLPASPDGRATHSVAVARDGRDEGAPARRLAVRDRHLDRVRGAARDGTLMMGGAILDEDGTMTGSVAVTAHASPAEARAWWSTDPYVTEGVWRTVEWHATRFAPLPYRGLAQG